jgi:WD40 repeat protein
LILLSQHRVVPGFDPSGATVAVPFGNEVRVLDAATMTPLRTLRGHTDKVTLARFSPDGQTLVTTSFDRTARLWSVESGAVRHVLEGSHLDVTCAVFSRDGELVATAGYEPIARIWDVDSGALVQRLEGHKTGIGGISFGPDGRRIATASSDTSILVWDVASGKREVAMEALAPAFGVAFSPDGDLLISIDASGRASVWDAHRGHILARLGFAAEFGYWVEFSADGARAAVSNGVGQIWGIERVRGPIDHVLDRNLPFVLVGDRVLPQQALDSAPSDK